MSLLTSPDTSREHQNFFNKMEKAFNKRSFFNENYTEPINPLQQANDSTLKSEQYLKQLMKKFISNLKDIIHQANNSRFDFYYVLSEMKSFDFFNEISNIIEEDLVKRNNKFEKQNTKLRESLKKAHQELRNIQRAKPSKGNMINSVKFNGIKSVAENLYQKARVLNEEDFVELCNKVILQEKVVINKVIDSDSFKKWDDQKVEKIQEKQLLSRVDAFIQNKQKQNEEDKQSELAQLISDFKSMNKSKQVHPVCQKPCCNTVEESMQFTSKALSLRKSTNVRRSNQFYKNDRSEQYFNRYYRKSEFDMHKVLNVEKTKMQEMQRMEDGYRITLKQRHKMNKSMNK